MRSNLESYNLGKISANRCFITICKPYTADLSHLFLLFPAFQIPINSHNPFPCLHIFSKYLSVQSWSCVTNCRANLSTSNQGGISEPGSKIRLSSTLVSRAQISAQSKHIGCLKTRMNPAHWQLSWYQDWASYIGFSLAIFTNQTLLFRCRLKNSSPEREAGF